MEITTGQIKKAKQLLTEGKSYMQVAYEMSLPFWVARRLVSYVLEADSKIDNTKITVTEEHIRETEAKLFKAIDDYHANPTLFNSQMVDNLNVQYSRMKMY